MVSKGCPIQIKYLRAQYKFQPILLNRFGLMSKVQTVWGIQYKLQEHIARQVDSDFRSSIIENSPSKGFLPAAAAAAMYPPREANGFPGTGAPPWADPGGP